MTTTLDNFAQHQREGFHNVDAGRLPQSLGDALGHISFSFLLSC